MKETAVRIVLGLLVLLLGGLVVWATEWVDVDTPTPAHGDAATNPFYATQALLRALGATVEKRSSLEVLPPPGARLLLDSQHWDLVPERAELLRDWVEAGGHLIIPPGLIDHSALEDWMPIAGRATGGYPVPSRGTSAKLLRDWNCRTVTEIRHPPSTIADKGRLAYEVCGERSPMMLGPAKHQPLPLWSALGPAGVEAIRMQVGQGSVTVLGAWALLNNSNLTREGSALVVTAALQPHAGAVFWFVAEESRQAFVSWLWRKAWPAGLLGLLALALALWRAAPRFGPLALRAGTARRSMAEQVRGTGRFLHRHGAGVLHAAQVRALDEAAARTLSGINRADAPQRLAAIAQATAINPHTLALALDDRARHPAVMARDLELIETARRRLLALARPTSS